MAVVVGALLATAVLPVAAIDQPISAKRLVIQRTGTTEKVSFISKDAAFLFPAVGSDDDPGIGSPGGVLVEIIAVTEPTVAFDPVVRQRLRVWRNAGDALLRLLPDLLQRPIRELRRRVSRRGNL
jgi:hypothetical protein